jgi:hypothetical protein
MRDQADQFALERRVLRRIAGASSSGLVRRGIVGRRRMSRNSSGTGSLTTSSNIWRSFTPMACCRRRASSKTGSDPAPRFHGLLLDHPSALRTMRAPLRIFYRHANARTSPKFHRRTIKVLHEGTGKRKVRWSCGGLGAGCIGPTGLGASGLAVAFRHRRGGHEVSLLARLRASSAVSAPLCARSDRRPDHRRQLCARDAPGRGRGRVLAG